MSGISTKYYNRNNKYSKRYFKDYRNDTFLIPDRGFPTYARPKILPKENDLDNPPDNHQVVLYNPQLLKKYKAYINMEVCLSVKAIWYIYKYIYKGNTGADIEIVYPEDDNETGNAGQYNKIFSYIKARQLGFTKVYQRTLGFPISEIYLFIKRLGYTLFNKQRIIFNPKRYDRADLIK